MGAIWFFVPIAALALIIGFVAVNPIPIIGMRHEEPVASAIIPAPAIDCRSITSPEELMNCWWATRAK